MAKGKATPCSRTHSATARPPTTRERSSAGWDVARTLATMNKPVKLCVKLLEGGGSHTIRLTKGLRGGEQVLSAPVQPFGALHLAHDDDGGGGAGDAGGLTIDNE